MNEEMNIAVAKSGSESMSLSPNMFHNSTMFPMLLKSKIKCLFFQILPPNPFLWLILNEKVTWGRGIFVT